MTGIDRGAWEADTEPWCTWVHADDAPMGCARYRAHLAGTTIDISARKALEQGLIETLNREQRRLSRDLHEGLVERLSGISLLIGGITAKLHNGHSHLKSQLDDVVVALRDAIEETRGLVAKFSPRA